MQGSFKIQPHSLGPKPTIKKVGLLGKGKEDQKLKWIKKKRNSSHVPYFVSGSDHSKHNHTPPIKKRKEEKKKRLKQQPFFFLFFFFFSSLNIYHDPPPNMPFQYPDESP